LVKFETLKVLNYEFFALDLELETENLELKTGNYLTMKKYFIILILTILAFSQNATADDVKFTASARETVTAGENFKVTFEVSAKASNFNPPDLKNFNILSGPSQSTSSSIQIIHSNVIKSELCSYTYILQAVKQGTFTIKPASVTVDGKTYKSNPLTINVVKGNYQQSQTNQNVAQNSQPTQTITKTNGKDIFIKTFVSKRNPYQGEQIIVTYKIYTKIQISQYSVNKLPSKLGFWSQDLTKKNQRPRQTNEIIDGTNYAVAEIYKTALFPQKTGKLTIAPLEIECIAQIRTQNKHRRSNDPFENFFNNSFFNTYTNVKKNVKSNRITINVKPLPTQNKPADFNGTLGNFFLKSNIDKTESKTNEPITLKFTISGKGNIKLIEKPDIDFPPDFETYDTKITDNISTSNAGISGSKTFEYLIIPRNPGKYTIKPVKFSFFDLSSKKYKTLTSPEYDINIKKGANTQSNVVFTGANKQDIKYIGKDIRFIKTTPLLLYKKGIFFFGSLLFYLLMLLPLIIFIIIIIIWRKHIKQRSNIALMKNKKATKIARKRLKKAYSFLKENNKIAFYNEISSALWGYLSDKLIMPVSELSVDNIKDVLLKKNINKDIIEKFILTLKDCEFVRFAPAHTSSAMSNIYNEAINTIAKIEKELNKIKV
jgi:hypothetical protein